MSGDILRFGVHEKDEKMCVETVEPTREQIEAILGEMIDGGVRISMTDALASVPIMAKAKEIWKAREDKRLKEAEEKAKREADAAQREEKARKMAAERVAVQALQQMLDVETAKPVLPEAIATFVEAVRKEPTAPECLPTARAALAVVEVVEDPKIAGLKQKYGSMLPALVFVAWQYAAAFRGWLAKYRKRVETAEGVERQKVTAEQDAEYISRLIGRLERFDGLFVVVNEVITNGWGKDPKKNKAEYEFFARVEKACNDQEFANLRNVPLPLTAEEKQKQADEAKAREVATKARKSCQSDMVARLINAGFAKEDAEKMASAWLRKWDGAFEADEVLATKAVNFALAGEADKAAKLAAAAGIMGDAFDALVGAKKAELAQAAEQLSARAVSNRGPQAGAAGHNIPPKKDKGGNKKGNKNNGGKEDRRRK